MSDQKAEVKSNIQSDDENNPYQMKYTAKKSFVGATTEKIKEENKNFQSSRTDYKKNEMRDYQKDAEAVESNDNDDDEESDSNHECSFIEKEEQLAATLPQMKGTVYRIKFGTQKGSKVVFKRKYGLIRNKKFKYYKDRTMTEMQAVFDFDRIQCVVMIDDGSDSHNVITSPARDEPRRFKIEVIGYKKEFIFEVKNAKYLREWTQALYANWHASKSFTLQNNPKVLNIKFWKVTAHVSLPFIARLNKSRRLQEVS